MKKLIFMVLVLILIILIGGYFLINNFFQEKSPQFVSNTNISGIINSDQTWSENIYVTGDIEVKKGITLTILPGTIIIVSAFSDDQHKGIDHPHDPPFQKILIEKKHLVQ